VSSTNSSSAAAESADRPPILLLSGPTAAGKSEWAERLAADAPIEIVSVDSALVYREMDIGTAKPSIQVRAAIPHHLIDIRDPAESYSAGDFVRDALEAIVSIESRGRIALLVGGTQLYLRALTRGLAALPLASPQLRATIDARAQELGWPALHAELARLDPLAAARIHPTDPQRIQRALEVCLGAGRPLSELQRDTRPPLADRRLLHWSLVPGDRRVLHDRIRNRFLRMLQQGFLQEVEELRNRGDLTAQHPAMRAVGYRQLWEHLDGHMTLEEATERAIAATRQLAKRQLTWIRADRSALPADPEVPEALENWRIAALKSLGLDGR
jgi:tRNA dimethylallyltransferase